MPAPGGLPALVVGGGVVGLACAAELARRGWWTVLVEREPTYGRGTSSRNSEVVHAGIYYQPGSLKARLCVEGRDRLYAYLAARGVPHDRCGKLIVATEEAELPELEKIAARAAANGVHDLRWLSAAEVRAAEPGVRAVAALESPSTGIVDAHALMHALAGDAQQAGADFAFGTEVAGVARSADGWTVTVRDAAGAEDEVEAGLVVNAAGLYADRVARLALPDANGALPTQEWVKGNYFSVRPGSAVRARRLIYPCPHPDLRGLGTHLTLDLAGGQRLGPDVERLPEAVEDYRVDEGRRRAFYEAALRFLPGLVEDDLSPAYSGLRPQVEAVDGFRDFYLAREDARGAPGWINLIGIESPGLTCALAIAERVAALADG